MTDGRRMVHALVHGHVQGVWYRSWTVTEARARGLDGWVRNHRDGYVEAVLAGAPEAVASMLVAMEQGPAEARVDRVEVEEEPQAPEPGFVQRPTI